MTVQGPRAPAVLLAVAHHYGLALVRWVQSHQLCLVELRPNVIPPHQKTAEQLAHAQAPQLPTQLLAVAAQCNQHQLKPWRQPEQRLARPGHQPVEAGVQRQLYLR